MYSSTTSPPPPASASPCRRSAGSPARPPSSRSAKAADDRGYSSIWAMDRLLAPLAPRTPYPASPDGELPEEQRIVLDPLGVLTLAAAVTERVRLGTSVLVAPWYAAGAAGPIVDHARPHQLRSPDRRPRASVGRSTSTRRSACRNAGSAITVRRSSTCSRRCGRMTSSSHRRRALPHRAVDDPAQAGAEPASTAAARRLHAGRLRPHRPSGRRVDAGGSAGRRDRADVGDDPRSGCRLRPRPRRPPTGRSGQHQDLRSDRSAAIARRIGAPSSRSATTSTPLRRLAPTRS